MKLKNIFLLFILTTLIGCQRGEQEKNASILPWALSTINILKTKDLQHQEKPVIDIILNRLYMRLKPEE